MTTTTGVFETIAELTITKAIRVPSATMGRSAAWASAILVNQSSAPVRTNAPMMMNMAAMVQGAGLDRTVSAVS